jgi:hypothetical protein
MEHNSMRFLAGDKDTSEHKLLKSFRGLNNIAIKVKTKVNNLVVFSWECGRSYVLGSGY